MAKNLTIGGWRILPAKEIPSGEHVILGFRDLSDGQKEYVVATVPVLAPGAVWMNGFYTRDFITAVKQWQDKVADGLRT